MFTRPGIHRVVVSPRCAPVRPVILGDPTYPADAAGSSPEPGYGIATDSQVDSSFGDGSKPYTPGEHQNSW